MFHKHLQADFTSLDLLYSLHATVICAMWLWISKKLCGTYSMCCSGSWLFIHVSRHWSNIGQCCSLLAECRQTLRWGIQECIQKSHHLDCCRKSSMKMAWYAVQAHMNTSQTSVGKTAPATWGYSEKEKQSTYKLHFLRLQLSFSPSTPMNSHVRVLCLLVSLLLDCCGLAVVCGLLGASHGMHTLSFMAAEVSII